MIKMNTSQYYNKILLEAENSNLATLDAKIDATLGRPSLLLKIYKTAILTIAAVTGATTIGTAAYIGYNQDGFTGAAMGIGIGLSAFLKPAFIALARYKIIDHIARRASLNLVNNNKIPKEEKLKIINGLITETKQCMAKLTDNKDKEHCQNALNQLYSALNKINQQI